MTKDIHDMVYLPTWRGASATPFGALSLRGVSPAARGVGLAFVAYAVFACGDAFVKSLGGDLSVFEIAFWTALFSALPLLLSQTRDDRLSDLFRVRSPRLVGLRVLSGTVGSLLAIHAFTTLPLAEAYALIFLAPFLTTVLSVVFLSEKVGWRRWSAVAIGFLGVLVVVRPGFRALELGHLAAAGAAFFGAVTVITLRRSGGTERRFAMIGWFLIVAMVLNLALMGATGALRFPSGDAMLRLFAAGCLGGLGHLAILAATRLAPANRIGPVQYGQIVWAFLFGALFFAEVPDRFAIAGMGLVVLSGLFTLMREEAVGVPAVTPRAPGAAGRTA